MRPIRTDEQRERHNKKVEDQQFVLFLISAIGYAISIFSREIYEFSNVLMMVLVPLMVFFPVGIFFVMVLSFKIDDGMYEAYEYRRYEQAKRNGDLNEDGTYKDHVI